MFCQRPKLRGTLRQCHAETGSIYRSSSSLSHLAKPQSTACGYCCPTRERDRGHPSTAVGPAPISARFFAAPRAPQAARRRARASGSDRSAGRGVAFGSLGAGPPPAWPPMIARRPRACVRSRRRRTRENARRIPWPAAGRLGHLADLSRI